MKTQSGGVRFPPALRRPGLAGLVAVASFVTPVRAAESSPAEAKSFVLFMGLDLDVQFGEETHRVKNVAGNSFVIAVNQQPVEVPMNRGPVKLKLTPQMKLTNKTAVVKGLKFERAYTFENDPTRKWARSQSGSAAQSYVGVSAGRMASAMMGVQLAHSRAVDSGFPTAGGGGGLGPPDPVVMARLDTFNRANFDLGSDVNSAGYMGQQLQEELDKELFDAVEVTCEISAPRPLRDPYVVVVTQYRVKDEPGVVKNWIYARALERLDEYPLKVKFLQGGFPPGFELVKQELHVYGAGRELGTNLSDQRVSFTRDEAHRHMVNSHVATHKEANLAPVIALGVSRKDFFPHYTLDELQREIFIKVDRDGQPGGIFRNEDCSEPAEDAYLAGLVGNTRFMPALVAGRPAHGVARMKIADLAI